MVNKRKNYTPGGQINLSWPLGNLYHCPFGQESFLCHEGHPFCYDFNRHTHTYTRTAVVEKRYLSRIIYPVLYSLLFSS